MFWVQLRETNSEGSLESRAKLSLTNIKGNFYLFLTLLSPFFPQASPIASLVNILQPGGSTSGFPGDVSHGWIDSFHFCHFLFP